MPSRGFADLPVELALSIVEFACEDEPALWIRELVLVSRLFSRLALPSLYRDLSDTNYSDDDPAAFKKLVLTLLFDPTRSKFGDFVHSFEVTEQEELGKGPLVIEDKSFRIQNHDKSGDDPQLSEHARLECEKIGFTKEKQDELVRLLDVILQHEDRKEVLDRWKKDFLDQPLLSAYLALTLMRLPNLTHLALLNVDVSFWSAFEYVADGLLSASKHPDSGISPPFPKLQHVTLGGEAPEYPHSTQPLTMLAKWPSITSVTGVQIGDGDNDTQQDPDPWFLSLAPRSTAISSVSFRPNCKLLSAHLTSFLGAAKALESFEYHLGNTWSWIPMSTPALTHALSLHKETLRTLHLSVDTPELDDEDSTFAPISLAPFSALHSLRIAYALLFGFDINQEEDLATRKRAAEAHVVGAVPRSLRNFSIEQVDDADSLEVACCAVGALLAYEDAEGRGGKAFAQLERVGVVSEGGLDAGEKEVEGKAEVRRIAGERGMEVVFRRGQDDDE